MGELGIRRNRALSVPQYQKMGKAEKQTGVTRPQVQKPAGKAAATVSETLRQLMGRVTQVERHIREGRRTLQSGEAALAEVEDNLGRMEELAHRAAGDGVMDRAVLQSELELLRDEVERIAQDGVQAGLFQDGEGADGLDELVDAVMDGLSARQDGVEGLPAWLVGAMTGDAPDRAALLAALGVDDTATAAQVIAALGNLPPESSSAAGYLAALYLGAVIAGGAPSGAVDAERAAEGLRQLLELVAEGMPPDEALDLLTGGTFTSMEDFQAQFTGGTAPELDDFLMEMLFSQDDLLSEAPMLDLLAGGGMAGMELELLMGLLSALEGSGDGLGALLDGAGTSAGAASRQMESMEWENLQAAGEDLSGVEVDRESGVLSADTAADVTLRGLGQEAPAIRLTGAGTLTLQQVSAPWLSAQSAQARVVLAGENALDQLWLGEGTTLTVEGGGVLHIGELVGRAMSVLRLTGGAVVLDGEDAGTTAAAVVVDGPAVLLAPEGAAVHNAQGEPLSPFDIVWKTLLPEWTSITSLMVDGRQGQLNLRLGEQFDPLRMWLLRGEESRDHPAHTIALRGRDRAGRATTQYIYVRWDEKKGGFQTVSMYPNPFRVTGGEPDVDWRYEEESQTLYILSNEVTAVSGGAGTDANQLPFSGRLVIGDGIGVVKLTLDGVKCRVDTGRAFSLGRGNEVTLLLQRGTDNVFESGPGCAGISLGDGTSLRIDQTKGGRDEPDGTLTATGGSGGAGIGRDSGKGQERTGAIHIRGGVITATGTGGGAGIGGALGAPVGDIRIQGGTVTAQAACCAAAIGAGIQGACGDILISGSAKVEKARGGGPDGDIGGCLFGSCGKVQVSPGTDIGEAKVWTQKGLSLQMGENTMTLPKFRVSARALRLDGLDLSSREAARAALNVLAADRRWVTRLQGAYGAMYGQLGQSFGSMYSVQRYTSVVRDTNEANSLAVDIREVLRLSPRARFLQERGMKDVEALLR